MPTLGYVQGECMIPAIEREWAEGRRRTILHAATGTGKTITTAKLIKKLSSNGRFLFVVDEINLVEQAEEKFHKWGIKTVVEMAERRGRKLISFIDPDVVIATRQTLSGPNRLNGWPPNEFKYGILDEVHLASGETTKRIMDYFNVDHWLGLSATPYFSDGRRLWPDFFESVAFHYPLKDYDDGRPGAISNGHLCPVEAVLLNCGVNLRGLKKKMTSHGRDLSDGQVADKIGPHVNKLVNAARMEIERLGCKTMMHFAPTVDLAIAFAKAYHGAGIRACAVYGDHPDKDGVIAGFKRGEFPMLVVCQMCNKGFDHPPIDCLVMGRPTYSWNLAWQQLGRGTRVSPDTGKEKCYVLGYEWESGDDGPVSTVDLIMQDEPDPAVRQIAREIFQRERRVDLMQVIKTAKQEKEKRERDAERKKKAAERRALNIAARKKDVSYRRRQFDPFRIAFPGVACVPTAPQMTGGEVDQRIKMALGRFGLDDTRDLTPQQAVDAFHFWNDRLFRGLAMPKDVAMLVQGGYTQDEAMKFSAKDARSEVGRIIAGWRNTQREKRRGFA